MRRAHFFIAAGVFAATLFAAPALADHERGFDRRGGDQSEIILYPDTDFRGQPRVFYGDVASLQGSGFNNEARSVLIRGGSWTLCEKSEGRGRCRKVTRSVSDLGRLGLDCDLTSFYQSGFSGRRSNDNRRGQDDVLLGRAGGYGASNAPIVLFSKDGFDGRSVEVHGATNLRDIGFDNKADSIAIQNGRWLVCTKRDLEGRCKVLGRSVYDLDDIDLDDNISSIAPYKGNRRHSRQRW